MNKDYENYFVTQVIDKKEVQQMESTDQMVKQVLDNEREEELDD